MLIQMQTCHRTPIILVGKYFWQGLVEWFLSQLICAGMIAKENITLISMLDDPKGIMKAAHKLLCA